MNKPWTILGTPCHFSSREEVLTATDLATGDHPVRIATINPEMLLGQLTLEPRLRVLPAFTHHTVDGFGLVLAAWWRRKTIPKRYPGSTMADELFARYSEGEKSFYFVGGLGTEAEDLAKTLRARYPLIRIVGAESGGIITLGEEPEPELIKRITAAKPDILLVGVGSAKQEVWIHMVKVKIPVIAGVGGTFGFYTTKKRAHPILRKIGLEWLGRAVLEKGHVRRLWRAVIVFAIRVVFTRN